MSSLIQVHCINVIYNVLYIITYNDVFIKDIKPNSMFKFFELCLALKPKGNRFSYKLVTNIANQYYTSKNTLMRQVVE